MAPAAIRPRLGAVTFALSAILALAIGASAAPAASTATAATCSGAAEQPFLPWVDPASYTLAPGGDFEAKTAWRLAGGAKVITGNEPFRVHGKTDSKALSIPAGGSATTSAICVGLGHPTLRLFAVGGNTVSTLKVEVIYKTALGVVTQPVGLVLAQGAWAPTLPMAFLANATGLLSLDGLTSSVQFRFTALGSAGWTIDDVYVDPWKVT